MHVIRVSEFNALADLSRHWNCLTRGVPFRGWEWLTCWWKHYSSQQRELYVLAVFDASDALIGVAPWYAEKTGTNSRTLRFLGSGEVCSDYLSLLSTPEHENAVVDAISQWLTAAAEPHRDSGPAWDVIEIDGVSKDDAAINRLLSHLEQAGCSVHCQPGLNCWRLELPASWSDYLVGCSKSRRRKIRKLETTIREQGVSLHVAQSDQLSEASQLLIRLHQARRQSLGEPGCFASQPFAGFYEDACGVLARGGKIKFSWIEQSQRPLAVETYLTDGATNYLYQSGIDPQALELSPGHLSSLLLIQKSIEEGQAAIDFLRGNEPYKAFWGAQPVPTQQIRIAANRIAPQIRHGVWLAGLTMKGWIKSGMELVGSH